MKKHNFKFESDQEAVAIAFESELKRLDAPECYFRSLPVELEGKRDFMAEFLQKVGMKPIVPEGGYFMIADWTPLGKTKQMPFSMRLCKFQTYQILNNSQSIKSI